MKTKNLLTVVATMAVAYAALAADAGEAPGERGNGYGNQQIVVNNYYNGSGYEYASRINRFHNSYVAFDFYSPLYTETFWYHYTPYTWGVSIYDDWYYYGGSVSRYNWTSGFGGSYWWGYDPWWDYDPWMGYGWNSWYAPGVSYGINYYLGRPYYHYPMAWNSWYNPGWNAWNPYYRYDNHYHQYGPEGGNSNYNHNNNNTGYYPSNPYDGAHRPGYSVSTRRSSAAQPAAPRDNSGSSQSRDGQVKSSDGTWSEHGRRSVPVTDGAKAVETETSGTTRVNETTVPRRETTRTATGTKTGTTTGTTTSTTSGTSSGTRTNTSTGTRTNTNAGTTTNTSTNPEKPPSVVRVTEPAEPRQQTQTVVRTNKKVKETTMRQSPSGSTSAPVQSTMEKSSQPGTVEAAEGTSPSATESGKTGSSSKSRR